MRERLVMRNFLVALTLGLLNFRDKAASANTGLDLSKGKVLLGNYPTVSQDGRLQPYEAAIYEF